MKRSSSLAAVLLVFSGCGVPQTLLPGAPAGRTTTLAEAYDTCLLEPEMTRSEMDGLVILMTAHRDEGVPESEELSLVIMGCLLFEDKEKADRCRACYVDLIDAVWP